MPNEIQLFGADGNAPFSLTELLINLAIGLVLAVGIRWHFLKFGSTLSNRDELGGVLPFVLMTTVLIITVVKSSLALSLGLVGALSIVRFRTPIKEPEELAYLFIAIAIGLGLGANQVVATVAAAIFILGAMTVLKRFSQRTAGKNLYLSVNLDEAAVDGKMLQAVQEIIGKHVTSLDVRRLDKRADGFDATYLLDLESTSDLLALSDELQGRYPGINITFLDQNGMPRSLTAATDESQFSAAGRPAQPRQSAGSKPDKENSDRHRCRFARRVRPGGGTAAASFPELACEPRAIVGRRCPW